MSLRTMLLASAAASLLAFPAITAQAQDAAVSGDAAVGVEAPADVQDPLAAAEKKVEAARTALRKAIATNKGVDGARQKLRVAIRALETARLQSGLPPANPQDLEPVLPEEAAAPPTDDTQNPADVAVEPPAPSEPPADVAAEPPAESVAPPVAVAVEPPADAAAEPPPPPPPAATAQTFDLNKFKARPKFGVVPGAIAAAPNLPATAEAVKNGAAIAAPDGRVILKQDGQVTINHDDTTRFRQRGGDVAVADTDNDTRTTTITRPDGSEVVTVRDASGNIVQRYRKNRDGNIEMLIGEASEPGLIDRVLGRNNPPPPPPAAPPTLSLNLGPLQLSIPEDQYAVESSRASPTQLQKTLIAPPVEAVERPYTLEEIRRSGRIRDKVRRIDFDTVTFDTGHATLPDDQIQRMQNVGLALRAVIERDPTQVFLIEGHTDAVGADLYNLGLSDRRAETVAEILAYYFAIPPENLITQGYGEQFLKIPTVAAERENRRVAFRNITYLMRGQASAQ